MDARFDSWLDARVMELATAPVEEPASEPDDLDEYRTECSRALYALADAMSAQESDARARRDWTVANAMGNRASAYRHAAAIVAAFRA